MVHFVIWNLGQLFQPLRLFPISQSPYDLDTLNAAPPDSRDTIRYFTF